MRHARSCGWIATIVLVAFSFNTTKADDWPQWLGPNRDSVVAEENLITTIPQEGLPTVWRKEVSLGYSGPVIADSKVFLFDYVKEEGEISNNPGSKDELTGKERLLCLEAETGEELWSFSYDCPYSVSYGGGPRAAPTYHNGHVYILGTEGNLHCLQATDGELKWSHDFAKDYDAKTPFWGHSAAPLVHDDNLICLVGGANDSLVIAFDLTTGKEKWKSLGTISDAGYCAPAIVRYKDIEQLVVWSPEELCGLDPASGDVYWQEPLKPGYGMSVSPPIVEGNMMYVGGHGDVGAMFKLHDDSPKVEVLWKGTPRTGVYLSNSTAIFDDGFIYGPDSRTGALTCVDAKDGTRVWQTAVPTTGSDRGVGAGHAAAFLMKGPKNYFIFSETGDFITAQLSKEGYDETGRFHAIDPTNNTMGRDFVWTFPAISNGKLYLRNDKEIVCYDISK